MIFNKKNFAQKKNYRKNSFTKEPEKILQIFSLVLLILYSFPQKERHSI